MSGNEPASPRARIAALAAFLLFAALLGVARADASLTKATDVAGPSRPTHEFPATVPAERSRFGFAEDLALLNVEKEAPRFSLIEGVETRRFERTYARNNPLKFLDPDGMSPKKAAVGWIVRLLDDGTHILGKRLHTMGQAVAARLRGSTVLLEEGSWSAMEKVEKTAFPHGKRKFHYKGSGEGHALPDGKTGFPHVQTDGEAGHTMVKTLTGGLSAALLVIDPWSEADAAGPEETMIQRGSADPRFVSYDRGPNRSEGEDDITRTDSRDGVGIPKPTRVCSADGECRVEMR